jgi:hypothetical protein
MSSDKLGLLPASLSAVADSGPAESSSLPVEPPAIAATKPAAKPRRAAVRKPKVVAVAVPVTGQLDLVVPAEAEPPAAAPDAPVEAVPTLTAAAAVAPEKRRRLKLPVPIPAPPPEPATAIAEAIAAPIAAPSVETASAPPPTLHPAHSSPAVSAAPAPIAVQVAAVASAQPSAAGGSTHPVEHRIHPVPLGRKRDALQHLLAQRPEQPTLIYTRTKHGADKIARVLERSGVKAASIHGDKSQGARNRALAGFKSGELKALVITDIAARLLDFEGLPLIISYDLPHITEDYVQRISRTGAAEVPGLAITIITQEESPQFRAVRDLLKFPLELRQLAGFETVEPFDPERDPPPRPGAESDSAEVPAAVAVEARRDGPGRGRRDRRGRQGRVEARAQETSPSAAAAPAEAAAELPEDAQPRTLSPVRGERPARNERKPRPDRAARGDRQPRGDQQPRGERQLRGDQQPGFGQPEPVYDNDDDDGPGHGNSLAAPPPSQLVAGGPGRRRGRRDPFATVVVDENRANIYDERQPDDYRDQWSVLGPDTNRPSWTYAEHQPQSLDAPPRRPNPPPAARRGGPGGGPRGPQSGQPRGAQRHGRPRRAEGR